MSRAAISTISVLVTFAGLTLGASYANSQDSLPISITACGEINEPGNYVATNDLVLTGGEDCLVISSSHVNIDMQGWTIFATCPDANPCDPLESGPVGGTAIHITNGAEHVTISNTFVSNFVNGIVDDADHASVTDVVLFAVVGISLNNASYSALTNISYQPGDFRYHSNNGPVLTVDGGGHNTFTNISGLAGGGFVSIPGAVISSNYNVLNALDMETTAELQSGPAIVVNGNHNYITNSSADALFGDGIVVAGNYNIIQDDSFSSFSPLGYFAAIDENHECGRNSWIGNIFSAFPPGGLTSPASCID